MLRGSHAPKTGLFPLVDGRKVYAIRCECCGNPTQNAVMCHCCKHWCCDECLSHADHGPSIVPGSKQSQSFQRS